MKKNCIIFLLTWMITLLLFTQSYSQSYNNTFGTVNNDEFRAIVKLPGGDCIASGSTSNGSTTDFYIARINLQGDIVWQKTYGGAGNDIAIASIFNTNGNILIAGTSTSFSVNGDIDVLLIEIDLNGTIIWARNYGNSIYMNEAVVNLSLSSTGILIAGNYVVPASVQPDMLAMEVSFDGSTINWQKVFDAYGDSGNHLIQNSAGGYIYVGATNSVSGAYDQAVLKLDASGNISSGMTIGSWDNENAHAVYQLSNQDIIVMGNVRALSGAGLDATLIKIKASDNSIEWAKAYGDQSSGNERTWRFVTTASNGYALVGTCTGFGLGSNDIALITTDENGNMTGFKTYGGTGNDVPNDLIQNDDGGYTLAAYTNSQGAGGFDAYLIRTDASLSTTGNCSPSTGLGQTISPTVNNLTMLTTNPSLNNTLVTTGISNTPSLSKVVVPSFSVTGVSQTCQNSNITFNTTKPGVSMIWGNTGTANVITNNANTYVLNFTSTGTYNVTGTYGACNYSQNVIVTDAVPSPGNYLVTTVASLSDKLVVIDITTSSVGIDSLVFDFGVATVGKLDQYYLLSYPDTGHYMITTRSYKGACYLDQSREIVIIEDNDINDPYLFVSNFKTISAFPNPNSGIFKIEVSLYEEQDLLVEIFDQSLTTSLFQTTFTNKKNYLEDIDISSFSSGTYVVKLTSSGSSKTLIVVKQ